jgi:hypothetical protein
VGIHVLPKYGPDNKYVYCVHKHLHRAFNTMARAHGIPERAYLNKLLVM